ncbi:hypothetical protein D915_006355 [Fasciola hepatica]|uniref:Uncharacterized protein n=1 Tax=Fasciola hepatica TaxID=6192 RepID=A0A4E0RX32_FASHE|nr:hypothetical protein D915_006355 [Fasciola hepatica]
MTEQSSGERENIFAKLHGEYHHNSVEFSLITFFERTVLFLFWKVLHSSACP